MLNSKAEQRANEYYAMALIEPKLLIYSVKRCRTIYWQ